MIWGTERDHSIFGVVQKTKSGDTKAKALNLAPHREKKPIWFGGQSQFPHVFYTTNKQRVKCECCTPSWSWAWIPQKMGTLWKMSHLERFLMVPGSEAFHWGAEQPVSHQHWPSWKHRHRHFSGPLLCSVCPTWRFLYHAMEGMEVWGWALFGPGGSHGRSSSPVQRALVMGWNKEK